MNSSEFVRRLAILIAPTIPFFKSYVMGTFPMLLVKNCVNYFILLSWKHLQLQFTCALFRNLFHVGTVFCKKICQSIPTINAHNVIRRSHKLRDLRSHCIQPICRECARSVSTPSSISTLGLDFYKHTSPANMFAEWRYIFQKILDGYIAIMARQKDLEAIVRQVDPRNSTTLRAMMKNKELDRNHELINKLMRELRSPINLDDLFICICCNPPQTAGGRLLNDLHNGVKKNVNCLEGGFFAPVKEEITPKVDETKSNDTDEKRSWEKEAGAGKPEGTTNEPNNNSQGKCSNKELFLKLKNGPKPGQVLAEISSCGTKDGKDVIAKESLKCLEHCFCDDETVMDLLKSAYKTIECGCFELLNDEVVLTKPGRNIVSPEILETVLSLMSGFKTKEKESFISKLNLRMMGSPAKIMQDNLLPNNEDVMTSVNMKATKVTVTITPKDARVSNNSNKRRTAQVVYVSSPYKDNPPPNNSPVVNPIPRTCAESESDDNLFQGPPNYDKSNDYTRVVEVADKSTQTMEYNGDDFTSDNYWLFNCKICI